MMEGFIQSQKLSTRVAMNKIKKRRTKGTWEEAHVEMKAVLSLKTKRHAGWGNFFSKGRGLFSKKAESFGKKDKERAGEQETKGGFGSFKRKKRQRT